MSRELLIDIMHAALGAVGGRHCVAQFLKDREFNRVFVIAIGKAATSMMQGAYDALDKKITKSLLITKRGHAGNITLRDCEVIESAHPVLDESSLAAGSRLLEFISVSPDDAHFLFLISGGTSSLVEVPAPGVDLAALQKVNQWLLASGLAIGDVNRVRTRLSSIKGGGLLNYLAPRKVTALFISDVPGDEVGDIGSGLLIPREAAPLTIPSPDWLADLLARAPAPAMQRSGNVDTHIVANNRLAREAAALRGVELGLPVHTHNEFIEGEAADAGARLSAATLSGSPGVHIWGGETTVHLPPQPGRGGRNQSLALAAAATIAGHDDVSFLAVGTDGTDGPGDDAGAMVDGQTIARGTQAGLDWRQCLQAADAGTFLAASGDLLRTGPTGTNVMDLYIGLKSR